MSRILPMTLQFNLDALGERWADVVVSYEVIRLAEGVGAITVESVTLTGCGSPIDLQWLIDLGFYSGADIGKACLDDFLTNTLTVVAE
jgi:hypothetical protein